LLLKQSFQVKLTQKKYAEWKKLGYHITLAFLTLTDPEIAIARVAARVATGGHNIPETIISRRFTAGL